MNDLRDGVLPGSFRDPSGFVFMRDGELYRQVNPAYREDYELTIRSGLYQHLVEHRKLTPHEEMGVQRAWTPDAYQILRPLRIPFVTYPDDWCFSQMKDAANLMLDIQGEALARGMVLKHANAFNIQFLDGKPVLTDALSFEEYREGQPWVAYRQFCQHFLAPLALLARVDIRLTPILRAYRDGIPLDLASRMLPAATHADVGLLTHIHMHGQGQVQILNAISRTPNQGASRAGVVGLVDNLRKTIAGLKWTPREAPATDHNDTSSYSAGALLDKRAVVSAMLDRVNPRPTMAWDLGANVGQFSRLVSQRGVLTISLDGDPAAVEKNYLDARKQGEKCLLPVCMDVTNPTPGLGWENRERLSLQERGPADLVIALALMHHLTISNILPFERSAEFFARSGRWLIVEFIPKDDPMAQRLLSHRKDIFADYTQASFERAFAERFNIYFHQRISETDRELYLMERKSA